MKYKEARTNRTMRFLGAEYSFGRELTISLSELDILSQKLLHPRDSVVLYRNQEPWRKFVLGNENVVTMFDVEE